MFTNFCFSENLLVAAANRFKVLRILISLKVTVYIQDRKLRPEKALDIYGFEWKSNCTGMAKRERERERERAKLKTWPSSLLYIYQRRDHIHLR